VDLTDLGDGLRASLSCPVAIVSPPDLRIHALYQLLSLVPAGVGAHRVHTAYQFVAPVGRRQPGKMKGHCAMYVLDGVAAPGNGDGLPRQRKAVNPASTTSTGGRT